MLDVHVTSPRLSVVVSSRTGSFGGKISLANVGTVAFCVVVVVFSVVEGVVKLDGLGVVVVVVVDVVEVVEVEVNRVVGRVEGLGGGSFNFILVVGGAEVLVVVVVLVVVIFGMYEEA